MVNPEVIGKTFTSPNFVMVQESQVNDFADVLSISKDKIQNNLVPPTFGITITLEQARDLLVQSGLNWERVVHGEQSFKYLGQINIGDELQTSATIETVKVAAGNEIATVRIDLTNTLTQNIVLSTTSVLVVRA